jgi:hypothetical protein
MAGTSGAQPPFPNRHRTRDSSTMMQRLGMAVGAGLAAALLFAVMVKGTLLAMALAYLAPLPVMIATLGWGLDMGALAAAIASLAAGLVVDPLSGGLFAVSIALPAWLLSSLALLRGGFTRFNPFALAKADEKAWFPIGGIVVAAALIGALFGAWDLVSLASIGGGYENEVRTRAGEIAPVLADVLDGVVKLPDGVSVDEIAAMMVRLSPALTTAATCLMLCANLYAAARVVQLSQRLKRPWSNLPEALVLPPLFGVGLIVCAALGFAAPGWTGHAAWIGVASLGCAYVMQGLAVVHSLLRGLSMRVPILIAVYLAFWGALPLPAAALAVIGLVESLLSLRARRAAAANIKS